MRGVCFGCRGDMCAWLGDWLITNPGVQVPGLMAQNGGIVIQECHHIQPGRVQPSCVSLPYKETQAFSAADLRCMTCWGQRQNKQSLWHLASVFLCLLSLGFVSLPVRPQSEQGILLWLLSLLQRAEPRIGCFHSHTFT